MKLKNLMSFVLILALTSQGCSALAPKTQTLSVTTDQPDAEIYVNGSFAGKGAASVSVKRNENVEVMAKKQGYETVHRSIGTHLNATSILDIIGGVLFIFPIFGLLAGGSKSLDQTNLTVMMVKNENDNQIAPKPDSIRLSQEGESVQQSGKESALETVVKSSSQSEQISTNVDSKSAESQKQLIPQTATTRS